MLKHFFTKKFFLLSFFAVFFVLFFASDAYAVDTLTIASLTNAFKSYITPPSPAPVAVVTSPAPKPVVAPPAKTSTPSTISEAELTTALRKILSKPEFASQLKGAQGPTGPQGAPGGSGGGAMYSSQTAASIQPSSPAPIPVVFRPAGISQPDPAHNFSGATYFSATNLSSNLLTTSTANVTTLSVTGSTTLLGSLNLTGTTSLTGGLNLAGAQSISGVASGTDFYLEHINTATGSATNVYGLKVDQQTAGTNNWNLWSGPTYADLDNFFSYNGLNIAGNVFTQKNQGRDFSSSALAGYVQDSTGFQYVSGIAGGGLSSASTSDIQVVNGGSFFADFKGSGTVQQLEGIVTSLAQESGTVVNAIGINILDVTKTGGTLTNNYGIKVDNQTAGTNNYNIWSGDPTIGISSTDTYGITDAFGEGIGSANIFSHTEQTAAHFSASIYGMGRASASNSSAAGGNFNAVSDYAGTIGGLYGVMGRAVALNTSAESIISVFGSAVSFGSGNISNNISFLADTDEGGDFGSGVITNNYGFHAKNLTYATNNYAFYTEESANPVGSSSSAIIASVAVASELVTINTTAPHGFVAGQRIIIAATPSTSVNGSWTISSIPSATSFTYGTGGTNPVLADMGTTTNTGTVTPVATTRYAFYGAGAAPSYFGGSIKIGGTALRATTEGTNHLDIFNGTAPVGTLTNGISLYVTAGELRSMDSAGNTMLLSPHDDDNRWIYDSQNASIGKSLKIDMELMMKKINETFGWDYVHETLGNETAENSKADDLSLDSLGIKEKTLIGYAGAFFDTALEKVENGVAYLNSLVSYKLTVGSPAKRTGVTLYDEVTGDPYCISVANGASKTTAGECVIFEPASTPSATVIEYTTDDSAPGPLIENPPAPDSTSTPTPEETPPSAPTGSESNP